jgi:hypothetical protein
MASAMEKPLVRSSEEKTVGSEYVEAAKHVHTIENLPDPDAGLSEEERAAHVRLSPPPSFLAPNTDYRTRNSSANLTSSSSHGSPSYI